MKIKKVFLCFVFLLFFSLVSCGESHIHTYSFEWSFDETNHWHIATCQHYDFAASLGEHSFVGNKCSVCGYEKKDNENYFIVSFVTNSDTYISPYLLKEGDIINRPSDPTKEDYCFFNWYDNSDLSGEAFQFGTRIEKDTTLYASYGVKVTFLNRDGSTYKEYKLNINDTVSAPQDPFISGLHFMSWYSDPEFENEEFNFENPISKNTTLYPKYGYQVTYLSENKEIYKTDLIGENEALNKPTDPTKENYDFENWYLDEELNNEFDFSNKLQQDITLYPNFTPKQYSIIYHNSDGLIHNNPDYYTYTIGYNEFSDIVENQTENDLFYGWYFDEEYIVPATLISTTSSGIVDVYAKRATLYNITYQNWPDGVENNNPSKYTKYDEVHFDLSNIKKIEGYSNVQLKIGGIAVPGIPKNTTGDIIVEVKYDAKKTTVTIDPNKGSILPNNPFIYVDFGIDGMNPVKVNIPKDNEKGVNLYDPNILRIPNNNLFFAGFYLDQNFFSRLDEKNVNEIEYGSTIYARWLEFGVNTFAPVQNRGDAGSMRDIIYIPRNANKISLYFVTGALSNGTFVLSNVTGDIEYCKRQVFERGAIQVDEVIDLGDEEVIALNFNGTTVVDVPSYSYSIEIIGYRECYVKASATDKPFTETYTFNEKPNLYIPERYKHEFVGWYDKSGNLVDINKPWLNLVDEFTIIAKYRYTELSELIYQLYDHKSYLNEELIPVDGINDNDLFKINSFLDSVISDAESTFEGNLENTEATELYLGYIDSMTSYCFNYVKEKLTNRIKEYALSFKTLSMIEDPDSDFDKEANFTILKFELATTINELVVMYREGTENIKQIYMQL